MGSTRLPGKVVKEINGLPLIVHIYRRLLACKELDQVAVAIGYEGAGNPDAQPILDVCKRYALYSDATIGVEDLIRRYKYATQKYNADAFVRITADCLFHDPEYVNAMVRDYRNTYPRYRGLSNWKGGRVISEGLDAEIYSTELLMELDRNPKCPREDFAVYAAENNLVGQWPPIENQRFPIGHDLHLSIDTQQDFDRAEKMLKILGNSEWRYEKTLEAYRKVMAEE